jgi:CheY-like chemotaxis protein/HPt (histidine-containing phosphotransfer) domain-containing protein
MKTIAIIEDNPDNRLLVRAILEPQYQVFEYESGFAGLEGLRQQKPDLVLLDVSLPGMDGAEVLRRIRADAHLCDLPVIALTAHAMAGDREKFVAAGFDDYVSKPILDEMLLIAAIQRNLPGAPPDPAPTASPSGSLDLPAIERLRKLGGNQFARDMIDLFLSYGTQKVGEARAAQQEGKLEAVADAVHPIKSSAGNIGAGEIQELCALIERSAKQQEPELVAAQLGELERVFAEIRPRLEAEKAKLYISPSRA